jgi:hypothetical protein
VLEKPAIEVKPHPERRVQTIIPSVPKCNVDELLAIEAPKRCSTTPEESPTTPTAQVEQMGSFGVGSPLPPIPATPDESEAASGKSPFVESPPGEEKPKQDDREAFFMTQVYSRSE